MMRHAGRIHGKPKDEQLRAGRHLKNRWCRRLGRRLAGAGELDASLPQSFQRFDESTNPRSAVWLFARTQQSMAAVLRSRRFGVHPIVIP